MTAKSRLTLSVLFGALVAGALTAFAATVRHAQLAAAAARPMTNGQHISVRFILAVGFIATTLAVGAVTFTAVSIRAWRRNRRYGYGPPVQPRRMRGYGGGW